MLFIYIRHKFIKKLMYKCPVYIKKMKFGMKYTAETNFFLDICAINN